MYDAVECDYADAGLRTTEYVSVILTQARCCHPVLLVLTYAAICVVSFVAGFVWVALK